MTEEYAPDVLVIGAGVSGWPAAVAAARAGAKTLLLESAALPGGQPVNQYVAMPDGGPRSGIVREYLDRLESRYALTDRPVDCEWAFWYMPSDILRVVREMIAAEDGLTFIGDMRVRTLTLDGDTVTGCIADNGHGRTIRVRAKFTVDATGSGALAEAAGCDVRYGEDSRSDFGESLAPAERTGNVQMCTQMYIAVRLKGAGWVPPGSLESGYGWSPGWSWSADAPVPEDMIRRNASAYLRWGGRFRCADTRDPEQTARTQSEALDALSGEFDALREHGFAVMLPPELGIREERRVMGEFVINQTDMMNGAIPDDSIIVHGRGIDIWKPSGGNTDYPRVKPYGMPYRSLIPKGKNGFLVVGKQMSGTHIAMASYRVQTLLGQMGQGAGAAAAFCALRGLTDPRKVVFSDLQKILGSPEQHLRCVRP